MNPQLADAVTDRLGITSMTKGQPVKPRGNQGPSQLVFELGPPLAEGLGLLEFHHREIVVNKLRRHNLILDAYNYRT